MPLPMPKNGEEEQEFIERCMADETMLQEFPDEKQRYAVCVNLWEQEDRAMEKRGAIAVHHTPTSDKDWDGPQNEANLRNDGDADYYRKAYAWQDPEADPDTKSAYKFIHHEVSSDGEIGPANIRACQTGIAVLNGARGGADIPDKDRQGVYNHLAAHLRDADIEPPDLRSKNVPEIRNWRGEIRAERPKDGGMPKIVGYAAVFDSWYEEPSLRMREVVRKGAFKKTIQESDIRALWNHDPNYVLGRTKNGTLKLREDEHGLWMEVTPPDTQWARDLITSIERGDVDQQSFGFMVVKDRWTIGKDGWDERELLEVKLMEVSPVTFPAYEQTLVTIARSDQRIRDALERWANGEFRDEDKSICQEICDRLNQPEPGPEPHSRPEEQPIEGLEILRRKLDLVELD